MSFLNTTLADEFQSILSFSNNVYLLKLRLYDLWEYETGRAGVAGNPVIKLVTINYSITSSTVDSSASRLYQSVAVVFPANQHALPHSPKYARKAHD